MNIGKLRDLSGVVLATFEIAKPKGDGKVFNSTGSKVGRYYIWQTGEHASVYRLNDNFLTIIMKQGEEAWMSKDLVLEFFKAINETIYDKNNKPCAYYEGNAFGALSAYLLINY